MRANICECSQGLIALAYDKNRCTDNVTANVVAFLWYLRRSPDADPFLVKNFFILQRENFAVVIDRRRQASRIVKRGGRMMCQ